MSGLTRWHLENRILLVSRRYDEALGCASILSRPSYAFLAARQRDSGHIDPTIQPWKRRGQRMPNRRNIDFVPGKIIQSFRA
jgi:hypothetical protein